MLDVLLNYIITSTGKFTINFIVKSAEQYISPNAGGDMRSIADKLKAEGITEGKAEVAQSLLKEGISIEVISRSTGLSVEEIEHLRP